MGMTSCLTKARNQGIRSPCEVMDRGANVRNRKQHSKDCEPNPESSEAMFQVSVIVLMLNRIVTSKKANFADAL